MQSPLLNIYDRLLFKILCQTAKFSDVDEPTKFTPKLVSFLTHIGRTERKLKSTSKKTLANQIVFQVNNWLNSAHSNATYPKLTGKNCWMAVLYVSSVLGWDVNNSDNTIALLKER